MPGMPNALIGSKKINPGGKKQPNKENQPTNQANNQKKYPPQKKKIKKTHQKTEWEKHYFFCFISHTFFIPQGVLLSGIRLQTT